MFVVQFSHRRFFVFFVSEKEFDFVRVTLLSVALLRKWCAVNLLHQSQRQRQWQEPPFPQPHLKPVTAASYVRINLSFFPFRLPPFSSLSFSRLTSSSSSSFSPILYCFLFALDLSSDPYHFIPKPPIQICPNSNLPQFKSTPIQICPISNLPQFKSAPIQIYPMSNRRQFKSAPIQIYPNSNLRHFKSSPIQICPNSNLPKFKPAPIQICPISNKSI